ncbi:somatostatin-1-like [Thalassophryne amazonica]|uniref:somatostatin-1-like n=1 Tax=Thalassophryne amazonica TaxID=390379 RepID=UPI00147228D6|nr:somatostatin-1-like [Thalassophryne amazonica]
MAPISCILPLICFAFCVVQNAETAQEFEEQKLNYDSLSWLEKLQDNQEFILEQNLARLLYKLFQSHNRIIIQGSKENAKRKIQSDTGLDTEMASRIRKAGCRVFFWKSWTAC